MDLNRQQKRSMQKMGEVNEQGAPIRQARPTVTAKATKERVGPFQYIREVRGITNAQIRITALQMQA